MNTFTTSDLINEAIEQRNVLAHNEVKKKVDYACYEEFVKNYGDARKVKEAKALYEN